MSADALKIAIKATRKSDHKVFKHGVVVTRGGNVLSVGHNRGHLHAEAMAFEKLSPENHKDTRVWSIRVTKGGKLANARPCPTCEELLRKCGVKQVWYSTPAGTIALLKL